MPQPPPKMIEAEMLGWGSVITDRCWNEFDGDEDFREVGTELYILRAAVRQLLIDVSAGSVPQETIDQCRMHSVDPHDALQMGWAACCFKLKALMDKLDETEKDPD